MLKYLLLIFIIFQASPINAQFASFNLDNVDSEKFTQKVTPFIQSISTSATRHFYRPINIKNRLGLGFSYSYGIDVSGMDTGSNNFGGYPNFSGSLLISDNLLLKGNFSVFYSEKDIVQSFAYGFGINITNKESNNWVTSVLFSQLQGPDDIKIKSFDGNIIYDFIIRKLKMFGGIGINSYTAKILVNSETIPNSIKGNFNHLILGTIINKGRIIITPIIQFNPDVVVMSLEFSGAIK